MLTDETDCSFPDSPRYFPAVPHGFERCTYAITFASRNRKELKQQTITKYDYPLAELIQGILNSADGFVINEIHILKNG